MSSILTASLAVLASPAWTGMLISIVIAVVIFCILWYVVSILPLPPAPPFSYIRTLLYILLCIGAIIYLSKYL